MLSDIPWRGGSMNVARVSSVLGSNMYSSGPGTPMQIDTSRPWRSTAIEPQSRLSWVDCSCGARPSGPPHRYASDRQPQDIPAAQDRPRDEDLAAGVDPLEQLAISLVASLGAEADDAERPRRAQLPSPLSRDPALELPRKLDAVADVGLKSAATMA